jgi:hypothetical protein
MKRKKKEKKWVPLFEKTQLFVPCPHFGGAAFWRITFYGMLLWLAWL